MASINGVGLKNVKRKVDINGVERYQGTLYYKGSAVGKWESGYHVGESTFDFKLDFKTDYFEEAYLRAQLKVSKTLNKYYGLDEFMVDLVDLYLIESDYRKSLRYGYKHMLVPKVWGEFTTKVRFLANIKNELPGERKDLFDKVKQEKGVNPVILEILQEKDFDIELGTKEDYLKFMGR